MNFPIHFVAIGVLVVCCAINALPRKKERLNEQAEPTENPTGATTEKKIDPWEEKMKCFKACGHCLSVHGKQVYRGNECQRACRKTVGKSIDPDCKNKDFLIPEKELDCLDSCKYCVEELTLAGYKRDVCKRKCRMTRGESDDPDCKDKDLVKIITTPKPTENPAE